MENYFHFKKNKRTPKIKNIIRNVSLILVNSHYAFGYSKPHLPNVIQVAGLHITKQVPLPTVSFLRMIHPFPIFTIGDTRISNMSHTHTYVSLQFVEHRKVHERSHPRCYLRKLRISYTTQRRSATWSSVLESFEKSSSKSHL